MDYEQARAYLLEIGRAGSTYGLSGIRNLMAELGNVQEHLKCIHVAGTNGKGSVCTMLASIFTEAGFRTGRYSSPAVFCNEEIYQIDGESITKADYVTYVLKCKQACEKLVKAGKPQPSMFEIETAIAFCYFADKNCEYAVIETGLGGLEDATNLISHPVCSVLTSISKDHMGILGESLSEIASAKAGIIKPGCPVVSALQPEEVLTVLKEKASQCGSNLIVCDPSKIEQFTMIPPQGSRFLYQGEFYQVPVLGSFQQENLSCVMGVIRVLQQNGILISKKAVKDGLQKTKIQGRMECLRVKPDFYMDGAHNEGAARALRRTVEDCFAGRRLIYMIGVLADKEYKKVLAQMLPLASEIYLITPNNARALSGEQLAIAAAQFFPRERIHLCKDIPDAVNRTIQSADKEGIVLAFGSLSFLGELKRSEELYENC